MRARDGDSRGLEELYQRHHEAVRGICQRYGPPGAAADLAQEAFGRLLAHVDDLEEPEKVGHWLKRVARNLAIDAARLHVHRFSTPVASSDGEAVPAACGEETDNEIENRLVVESVLGGLRVGDVALLVEHYLLDRPLAEIAERQGSTPGSVKVRLHRSRQRAREVAGTLGLRGLVPAPLHRWLRTMASALQQIPLAPVAGALVGGVALGLSLSAAAPAAGSDGASGPVVAVAAGTVDVPAQGSADSVGPDRNSSNRVAAQRTGSLPPTEDGRRQMVDADPLAVPVAGARINAPPPESPDYEIGVSDASGRFTPVGIVIDDPEEARPVADAACSAAEGAPSPVYCERDTEEAALAGHRRVRVQTPGIAP